MLPQHVSIMSSTHVVAKISQRLCCQFVFTQIEFRTRQWMKGAMAQGCRRRPTPRDGMAIHLCHKTYWSGPWHGHQLQMTLCLLIPTQEDHLAWPSLWNETKYDNWVRKAMEPLQAVCFTLRPLVYVMFQQHCSAVFASVMELGINWWRCWICPCWIGGCGLHEVDLGYFPLYKTSMSKVSSRKITIVTIEGYDRRSNEGGDRRPGLGPLAFWKGRMFSALNDR